MLQKHSKEIYRSSNGVDFVFIQLCFSSLQNKTGKYCHLIQQTVFALLQSLYLPVIVFLISKRKKSSCLIVKFGLRCYYTDLIINVYVALFLLGLKHLE